MNTKNTNYGKREVTNLSRKLQLTAFILLFIMQANAQVSINVNIGSRPTWCESYNDEVEYVYYPEIETYYHINAGVFIYFGSHGWIRSRQLPEYCDGYDYRNAYRVAIDYRGSCPYTYFNVHKKRYYRENCRNYREEYYNPRHCETNYVVVSNHRSYNHYDSHYYRKQKHDNGRHRGHGHRR
jgi:hypothetical protein